MARTKKSRVRKSASRRAAKRSGKQLAKGVARVHRFGPRSKRRRG